MSVETLPAVPTPESNNMKPILLSLFGLSALAVSLFAQQKAKLNEPFSLGDYTYTFTGARESKELARSKHVKKKPDEGAAFLVVYYTIENMTHEPITGWDFKN